MVQDKTAPNPIRYTTRGLLLLTLICAVATALCVSFYNAVRRTSGVGPYATFEEWPRSLVALIGEDKTLRDEVEPFGLSSFIDHRSIWRIKPDSNLCEQLFEKNELGPTDINHPKVGELVNSVPSVWGKYPWSRCTWFATPGYGSIHIEGVDLFLVAEDPDTGELIVLHEWIF